MTTRILNPGPSLSRYVPGDFAGRTLAVNRAALAFPCHVWCATDYPVIRDYGASVTAPAVLTRRQTWLDIGRRFPKFAPILVEDIRIHVAPPWLVKTMTCAIAYAFATGAKRIELYGCDWEGTADYDGVNAGEDRSVDRWNTERAQVTALAEWMKGAGVEVIRMA